MSGGAGDELMRGGCGNGGGIAVGFDEIAAFDVGLEVEGCD